MLRSEERADIVDQKVGFFQRGEVSTSRHTGPVHQVSCCAAIDRGTWLNSRGKTVRFGRRIITEVPESVTETA